VEGMPEEQNELKTPPKAKFHSVLFEQGRMSFFKVQLRKKNPDVKTYAL
jgi:hypothetical protein